MTETTVVRPLMPPEVELRSHPWMPLNIQRLRRSKAWRLCKRQPELAFYMLNLWTEAWHETPAGSLEDDDLVLAEIAMCGAAKWVKVRASALHGWIKADDGRLYHPVIAALALEAWLGTLASRLSSGAGNAKRWGGAFDPSAIEAQQAEARDALAALDPQSPALSRQRSLGRGAAGGTPGAGGHAAAPGSPAHDVGAAARNAVEAKRRLGFGHTIVEVRHA